MGVCILKGRSGMCFLILFLVRISVCLCAWEGTKRMACLAKQTDGATGGEVCHSYMGSLVALSSSFACTGHVHGDRVGILGGGESGSGCYLFKDMSRLSANTDRQRRRDAPE